MSTWAIEPRADAGVNTSDAVAYAAPTMASFFFYIPMWSVLPGIYSKYFGLSLTAIAGVVLFIRLFDGAIDTLIGYLSDRHRLAGGSRKSWAVVGALTTVVACHFLFDPPQPATTTYYLVWSLIYFMAFTIGEIPHVTWGSELTMNYQGRTLVYGARFFMTRVGIVIFYALPLLPIYATADYTPEVLRDAVYVGAALTIVGVVWMMAQAPAGLVLKLDHEDSWRLFFHSIVHNKPLLLYFCAYICVGLSAGMWYGLLFFFIDSYLGLGSKVAIILLLATACAGLSTPLWLKMIDKTSKITVWAIGVALFCVQLFASLFLAPGVSWWMPFVLIVITNLYFSCNDVAAMASLGDIIDYGKLKFRKDRGATYFAFNTLIFKVGLGVGGGLALATAGLFGFDPANPVHDSHSILGLKLGFLVLPMVVGLLGIAIIVRMPITRRRHGIIRRRIEALASR